ncbi:MAG: ABC transporter permease [Chloroflexi bacterium]|nr:ABC transporter permease [Chloroflexota bacterium]
MSATILGADVQPTNVESRGRSRRGPRITVRDWLGLVGLAFVVLAIAAGSIGTLLLPQDPLHSNLALRLKPPAWLPGSDPRFLFGTDQLGRDLLARVALGARVSLAVGLAATALASVLGVGLGLLGGFYRGAVDAVLSALTDIQLAFPLLALAISIVAVLGPGLANLILVMGVTGWVTFARIVRAEVLSMREREYVLAARALGAGDARILLGAILPNVLGSVTVVAAFTFAQMIVVESSLSFLGLGVQPPTPSWGGMLNDARTYLQVAWWPATFPGLALLLTVLGVNLLGDWLRGLLDPRLRRR